MTETTVFKDISVGRANARPLDYAAALGRDAWGRLAPAVRTRISAKRARYVGVMDRVELSLTGSLLAWLAVPFGRPLITRSGTAVPMSVEVSPTSDGGSCWQRRYHFPGRPPVDVASVKRVTANGTLVECLGGAVQMHLDLREHRGALIFESCRYSLTLGPLAINLPPWLSPGRTRVRHRDLGDGTFEFTLSVSHPLFGRLTYQRGRFTEALPPTRCTRGEPNNGVIAVGKTGD